LKVGESKYRRIGGLGIPKVLKTWGPNKQNSLKVNKEKAVSKFLMTTPAMPYCNGMNSNKQHE